MARDLRLVASRLYKAGITRPWTRHVQPCHYKVLESLDKLGKERAIKYTVVHNLLQVGLIMRIKHLHNTLYINNCFDISICQRSLLVPTIPLANEDSFVAMRISRLFMDFILGSSTGVSWHQINNQLTTI
jgi:hypothetical protein